MRSWSKQDERMYEHVKNSELDAGRSKERAKEIAARTVNKQRREEGRTPNKTTQGTGNPITGQLYNRAKQLDVEGRSKMNKDDLVEAIRKKQ